MRKGRLWLLVALIVVVIVSLACGDSTPTAEAPEEGPAEEATEVPAAEEPPAEEEEEEPEEAEPTEVPPTEAPEPTATPEPEPTEAAYQEAIVLLEYDGTGEIVSDNFELPTCQKTAFYWSVAPGAYGSASLILNLHEAGAEDEDTLVNMVELDASEDATGSTVRRIVEGEYYFSSENSDEAWSVRVECQDGQSPSGEGLDLEGAGTVVSPNFSLPDCGKSVFSWTVQAGNFGSTSLILGLCSVDPARCVAVANEVELDITEPMTGEALEPVSEGIYFIVTDNTSEAWHILWECRD